MCSSDVWLTTRSMSTRMPRCFAPWGEFDKISDRAVARIDAVIIGHVVAVIAMGRDLEWHQPDGRDAETMQVVEAAHQTLEIADAVGVGIHVDSNRQAIDHGILVPKVIDHGRRPNGIEATSIKTRRNGFGSLVSDRAPTTIRAPEIQQSIEIFSRHCLGHCRPQQRRRYSGSRRQDQKTFPMAQRLEKKAGWRSADRSGDGDQGADEPAYQVESAGASGQIGDHQDCEYGDGRSADAAE